MHDTAHISALLRCFIMHMSCLKCYLAVSHSSIFVLSWGTYKSNEVVTALAAVSDAWDSTCSAASISQQTHCRALITIKYRTNQLKQPKVMFYSMKYGVLLVLTNKKWCFVHDLQIYCSRLIGKQHTEAKTFM